MTEQLALRFERSITTIGPCAFGDGLDEWDGPHHCAKCAAEVERAHAAFMAAVAKGEYDEQGYTPAERRAQQKRATA